MTHKSRLSETEPYMSGSWLRPYSAESTPSRPIREVKLLQASSVLWSETTREYEVS